MLALASPVFFASALAPFAQLKASRVVDPRTGASVSPLEGLEEKQSLVVVLPQLGEFDSSEFCEHLVAVQDDIERANVELRVIGIGDVGAAKRFSKFTGLPLEQLRVDPEAAVHRALGLHAGPDWEWPAFVSDDALALMLKTLPGGAPDTASVRPVATAWLRYLAMCAGIGAPGTLAEIFRGYVGDASAPERLAPDAVVTAGPVVIGPGVGPVALGPIKYTNVWADESGFQRPVELATVRLRNMVEVLSNWDAYVSSPTTIAQRGATFLFDAAGEAKYSYRHRGVLTYSETMARPLSFLAPVIGEAKARNPLGLGDAEGAAAAARGRGPLKAAGRAMALLQPLFKAECMLQASAVGVDASMREGAQAQIEAAVGEHEVVVFTYGLSPFSIEAIDLLDAAGATCHVVEVGPEWFLLGKEASAMRLELLERTGQSSLPHVFIGGQHIGGLFTGPSADAPGVAALGESGKLAELLAAVCQRQPATGASGAAVA